MGDWKAVHTLTTKSTLSAVEVTKLITSVTIVEQGLTIILTTVSCQMSHRKNTQGYNLAHSLLR